MTDRDAPGRATRSRHRSTAARMAASPTASAATPRGRSPACRPPLSRPAGRGPAGAARPHDDAQSPRGRSSACRRQHCAERSRERRARLAGVPLSNAGLPVWRYGARRRRAGEAVSDAAPAEHRVHHLTGWSPATRRRAAAAAAAVTSAARGAGRRGRSDGYRLTVRDRRYEIYRRRRICRPCACSWTARRPHVHRRWRRMRDEIVYRIEASAATNRMARCGARATSRPIWSRSAPMTLVASTEAWETMLALDPGRGAAGRDRAAAGGCSRWPSRQSRQGLGAELVLAADQFIITPGRPRRGRRARASRRRRGAHRHRRLPLVHRLGPRHDDQPRRADADHRPARRGRLHPAHLRPLRPRRPDPQHVPRGREARASTTRPTPRSGSSTPSTATSQPPATATTLSHCCCRSCTTSSTTTSRGTRFGIGVDPADGLLRQGAEGYQLTWMDAKVGDWVVTPRRGKAVEINALWYNALRLLEGWLREEPARPAGRRHRPSTPSRRAHSFNERFWYDEGGYLYDVVDGENGRRPGVPPEPALRDLARPPGARPASAGQPVLRRRATNGC